MEIDGSAEPALLGVIIGNVPSGGGLRAGVQAQTLPLSFRRHLGTAVVETVFKQCISFRLGN